MNYDDDETETTFYIHLHTLSCNFTEVIYMGKQVAISSDVYREGEEGSGIGRWEDRSKLLKLK